MRPIELRLAGFTSFRTPQRLDFSQLDLFAIVGATGAGKSSLLDAITLALYGKVARGATPSDLLSQGSPKMQVEFRFEANSTEYRAFRSWSFRTKTPKATLKLEKLGNDWDTIAQKDREIAAEVERILGMDFETFTKTILLPQGEFDRFLKGSPKDRREILRRLAGYQIFEKMRQTASERQKLLQAEVQLLNNQLEGLVVPEEAEVQQKRDRHGELELALPQLATQEAAAKQTLDGEQLLFDRLQRVAALRERLTELQQRQPQVDEWQQKLDRARACDRLQGLWELVRNARQRDRDARSDLAEADTLSQKAEADLARERQQHQQVRAEGDRREPELRVREQALTAARAYEEQRKSREEELQQARQAFETVREASDRCQQDLQKATANLQRAETARIEAEREFAAIRFEPERLQQIARILPALSAWQVKGDRFRRDRDAFQAASERYDRLQERVQSCEARSQQVREACDRARSAYDRARNGNAAAVVRQHLHTGENCPVCGGKYAASNDLPALAATNLQPLQQQCTLAESNLQQALHEQTSAQTQRDELAQTLQQQRQGLEILQRELEGLQRQLADAFSGIAAETARNPQALQREYERLQSLEKQYREARDRRDRTVADWERSQQALQFARQQTEAARAQTQQAQLRCQQQQEKLQEIGARVRELTGDRSYETLTQQLERDRQHLSDRLAAADLDLQKASEASALACQQRDRAEREAREAQNEAKERENAWQQSLDRERLAENEFLAARATPEDRDRWQQEIQHHQQQRVEREALLARELEEVGDRTTDAARIDACRQNLEAATQAIAAARQESQELALWLQNAERVGQQARAWQAQRQQKQETENTYRTLALDLRTDKFQAYLLENFEQDLVEEATVLLRELTGDRYALKYDREYWVEDYWNGGELRKVKTLSGGETFAASLSLALALSERLARGRKLGCLFIDEGFGTLDGETLESVTYILESLRQRDRMVGVITHVTALGDRLGTQIRVEKYPEGSQAKVEGLAVS